MVAIVGWTGRCGPAPAIPQHFSPCPPRLRMGRTSTCLSSNYGPAAMLRRQVLSPPQSSATAPASGATQTLPTPPTAVQLAHCRLALPWGTLHVVQFSGQGVHTPPSSPRPAFRDMCGHDSWSTCANGLSFGKFPKLQQNEATGLPTHLPSTRCSWCCCLPHSEHSQPHMLRSMARRRCPAIEQSRSGRRPPCIPSGLWPSLPPLAGAHTAVGWTSQRQAFGHTAAYGQKPGHSHSVYAQVVLAFSHMPLGRR